MEIQSLCSEFKAINRSWGENRVLMRVSTPKNGIDLTQYIFHYTLSLSLGKIK